MNTLYKQQTMPRYHEARFQDIYLANKNALYKNARGSICSRYALLCTAIVG